MSSRIKQWSAELSHREPLSDPGAGAIGALDTSATFVVGGGRDIALQSPRASTVATLQPAQPDRNQRWRRTREPAQTRSGSALPQTFCNSHAKLHGHRSGIPAWRRACVTWLLAQLSLGACGGESPSAQPNSGTTGRQAAAAEPQTPVDSRAAGAAARTQQPSAGQRASQVGTGAESAAPSSRASAAGMSGSTQPSAAGSSAGASALDTATAAGASAAAGSSGAAATGGTSGSATQAPCPASNALKAGDNRKTLMHDSRERRFNVYVPSSITAMSRVPLVLDFHGNGSSGMQEQSGSGWRQKADAEQFIVVYPDGIGNGWNVGNCCGEALNSMVDDVGFARAMVEAVSSEACIDAHRVYATGISNGAGLAHRLACEAADIFAAIAAASADLVTDPCTPARPISEISVRGLNDTLVAYEGGNTGSTGWYSPGAKGTLELWKTINGCMGSASTTLEHCETYTQCNAGVEVTLCSLPNTGHILYTNSLNFSVPDNAWEMFKRQTLP